MRRIWVVGVVIGALAGTALGATTRVLSAEQTLYSCDGSDRCGVGKSTFCLVHCGPGGCTCDDGY